MKTIEIEKKSRKQERSDNIKIRLAIDQFCEKYKDLVDGIEVLISDEKKIIVKLASNPEIWRKNYLGTNLSEEVSREHSKIQLAIDRYCEIHKDLVGGVQVNITHENKIILNIMGNSDVWERDYM